MRRSSTLVISSLGYLIHTHFYPSPPSLLPFFSLSLSLSRLLQIVFRGLCCNRSPTQSKTPGHRIAYRTSYQCRPRFCRPYATVLVVVGTRKCCRYRAWVGVLAYMYCIATGVSFFGSHLSLLYMSSPTKPQTPPHLCRTAIDSTRLSTSWSAYAVSLPP